jgi:hypothetical protein
VLHSCSDFVSEEVESAEMGQGHGRRAHVSTVLGMPDRIEQERNGLLVVASVAA